MLLIPKLVARLWWLVSAKSRPLYQLKVNDIHYNGGCLGPRELVLKTEKPLPLTGAQDPKGPNRSKLPRRLPYFGVCFKGTNQ